MRSGSIAELVTSALPIIKRRPQSGGYLERRSPRRPESKDQRLPRVHRADFSWHSVRIGGQPAGTKSMDRRGCLAFTAPTSHGILSGLAVNQPEPNPWIGKHSASRLFQY